MTCVCCPKCRLRFSEAASIYLAACPGCDGKPQAISSLADVLGFQLINLQPPAPAAAAGVAAAVSLPLPGPAGART
jgi:hypothetical protein